MKLIYNFKKAIVFYDLNTSYLTDSCIDFTLKMESVSKMTIFGLKMMVKIGLEKNILKFHEPLQKCCCPVQKKSAQKG